MLERQRREWSAFRRGRPGSRFRKQYERQRTAGSSRAARVIRIAAGLVLLPVGVFLLPAPGPGVLVVALGAALVAREFEAAARFLDAAEVQGRRAVGWVRRTWKRVKAQRA